MQVNAVRTEDCSPRAHFPMYVLACVSVHHMHDSVYGGQKRALTLELQTLLGAGTSSEVGSVLIC